MKKKVCILGFGRSLEKAPFQDDSYEFWSCNEGDVPRFDKHFELHPLSVQNEREIEWLSKCEKPVYVLNKKEFPFIKNAIDYPLEEILKQTWAINYFCCTMAYQLAMAIQLKFEEIELWGLNMDYGSPRERTVESACMQYWVGIARGMGIKVRWDEHPAIYRWSYGYEYHQEMKDINDWVSRLVVHSIYRLGPTTSMGGDNLEIRKPDRYKELLNYVGHKEECELDDFHECTCGLNDIIRG